MRRKKVTRRRAALRWLAALVALIVFVLAAELYCFTPQQAIRKMARQNDLGELVLLETMDGQLFEEEVSPKYAQAYVLQNQDLTCLAFGSFGWYSGWNCSLPNKIEHGEQPSVPVDFLMDYVEMYPEGSSGPILLKKYVLGIVLDPAVETVELGVGEWIQTEDAASFETAMTVSISREDWRKGPYYDWFFCMLDPADGLNFVELRALDQNGAPITWTDLEGNAVEWYDHNWPEDYCEDGWWRISGERP